MASVQSPIGCPMRRSLQLLLATILLLSAPFAMARNTIVSSAQENCPGANAEAEAGDVGLDAGLVPAEPARKPEPAGNKAAGKSSGNGLGKGGKSRWRALLPGAMR